MTNNHQDDTSGLKSLGNKETNYQYNQPDINILETFPNQYQGREYAVTLEFGEFTSLCPKTSQPDFAELTISYIPDKVCVETKSLKLYLFSYRNYGSFMETITNRIYEDLFTLLNPRHLQICMQFNTRGGIALSVARDSNLEDKIMNLNKVQKLVEDEHKPITLEEIEELIENGDE